MRDDAGFVAKKLYRYGTSNSPVKCGIAGIANTLIEATSAKERTAKKNLKAEKAEREKLEKFLNARTTQNTLERLGVNNRAFNVAVFRTYPFNAGKYDNFVRAFVVLRDELRSNIAQSKKLNPSKYDEIVQKMITNKSITSHADYVPMQVPSENDSDEYSESEVEEQEDDDREPLDDSDEQLGYSDDGSEDKIAKRDTFSKSSVLRMVDGKLENLQIGGFCHREMSKLKDILVE